ncbi:MAG TPA: HAD family phosphatase [Saprospiraceae bacterium]|nr:HAD family phosphatase [Saprospiraceae bacterium]
MIRNILFDFGNVLLTLDEEKTNNSFREILDPQRCEDIQEIVFDPFERGEISEEAFFNRLQRRSKEVLSGDIYVDIWNSMLGHFPDNRIQSLISLRTKYKILLLSNTNITHIRTVKRRIKRENGLDDFEKKLFDNAYFSHEIHMRKPEERIYKYVLEKENLIPHECLFIDDKIENCDSAMQCGIHAYHHNPKEEIFDLLDNLIDIRNG